MNTDDVTLSANPGGITDCPGFAAAGASCDIRGLGNERCDVAIVYSESPCAAAGTLTNNVVKAAPVLLCAELLNRAGKVNGIIANSGNANACTGEQGMRDAAAMADIARKACGTGDGSFLVCSTGRIGRRLPMERVARGIEAVADARTTEPEGGLSAAEAILTSDTRRKLATARFVHEGKAVTVAGFGKGAGMIQPNMATMLAFIGTDAAIDRQLLRSLLAGAVAESFNAITVDGDMSTNDTVLALANGASGVEVSEGDHGLMAKFRRALTLVCAELADKMVSDGERITKVVEVLVRGAASAADAERVARSIGNSLLVKTSWFGSDPNWGRIMDAAGYAGVDFREADIDLHYSPYPRQGESGLVPALLAGASQDANLPAWKKIVSERRFSVVFDLGMGDDQFRLLANDLSVGYVEFNKSE